MSATKYPNLSATDLEELIAESLPVWIEQRPALRRRLHSVLYEETDSLPERVSYETFLEWLDEDTLAEWVDGDIVMTSPASLKHQLLSSFLIGLVGQFVDFRHQGVVLAPPFQMKLANSGREPDLLFVSAEHLNRLQETYLDGPADLAVEIISPESFARDRGDKFYEYEAGGVAEYWLIDPLREQVEFYQVDQQGRYKTTSPDVNGWYHSKNIPGFRLKVDWLWQSPLPSPLRALAQVVGLDAALLSEFEKALSGQS